jgi:predicted PurR-regulated permease PerM
MPLPPRKSSSAESLRAISHVLIASFVIATLYFGRELLVPFSLAALLTFLLSPVTTWFQRWIGRVGAVLLVVTLLLAATGAGGWILTRQALDLANQIPSYKENIRTKLRSLELPTGGPFSKISETVQDLKKDFPGSAQRKEEVPEQNPEQPTQQKPVPVEVVRSMDQPLQVAQVLLAPVLGPIGMAGLVLLLLIFMLLQREELRNRFIRLIGEGRISATTRAMNDAGARVTRYLLMLLIVNVTYGIPVAIGLYFIGVPNAVLWGSLAIGLRFVPYVGPWIAASFPVLLSLAISPDWKTPFLTISLFIVLELLSNNLMEPWLYGTSTGVAPIALIVAALVWTWLWGPVGLVLATPITVCLVVMGRHIPGLAFLSIAMSDEEALTPAEECYLRLHRPGDHEDMDLVDHFLKSHSLPELYDQVLVPVVAAAEKDHRQGLLEQEQLESIEEGLKGILDELELRTDLMEATAKIEGGREFKVSCLPARAYRDELAASMLAQLLRKQGLSTVVESARKVTGERVSQVRENPPDLVCVAVVPPTRRVNARFLCSKLKEELPELKILVGVWGGTASSPEEIRAIRESGADEVVSTVADAAEWIIRHVPGPPHDGEPV